MSAKSRRMPSSQEILDALLKVVDINIDGLIKLELIIETDKAVIVKETRYPKSIQKTYK